MAGRCLRTSGHASILAGQHHTPPPIRTGLHTPFVDQMRDPLSDLEAVAQGSAKRFTVAGVIRAVVPTVSSAGQFSHENPLR